MTPLTLTTETAPNRARRPLAALTLLLAATLTGCMDFNKTITNPTNQTKTTLELEIEIPGDVTSFPGVNEWYEGNQPSQTVKLGRNVFTGGTRFKLIWKVNVPPEMLKKYRFGLVRYITTDPESQIRQEGVYQSPLARSAPRN
jgi:hypothetical protein